MPSSSSSSSSCSSRCRSSSKSSPGTRGMTTELSRRALLSGGLSFATAGLGLASAGLGLASAGCEALRGEAVPENPVWLTRPGGALSIAWRRLLTDPNRIVDQPYERGKPAIDPEGMRVFVGSQDGGLYAVDARSGEVIWRF